MTTSVAPRAANDVRPTFGSYDAAGVRTITEVIKRDGRRAPWDPERITRAIALAFWASRHDDAANPHANDAAHRFGLGFTEFADVCEITQLVVNTVERKAQERTPTVEEIQDIVEMMIAARGHWDVAKRYVIYRAARAQVRLAASAGELGTMTGRAADVSSTAE